MVTTTQYLVHHLPMNEIFYDAEFNCRGELSVIDFMDLARDIKARGLDVPVVVRPMEGKFKYHLIAGHRRFKAIEQNYSQGIGIPGVEFGTIPAFIRYNVDEMEARRLNLRENLHRKNLNPLQEARALQYFLDCKGPLGNLLFNDEELAMVFGQSRGWVQNRRTLLTLPIEIQEAAASGLLTADHIKKLAKMKSRAEQFELVRKIKDANIKGDKINLTPSIKRPGDALRTRCRNTTETTEMSDLLYDMLGANIATRFAAWQRGIISTVQLLQSVKEYCDERDINYVEPSFIKAAMTGSAA